MIRFSASKYPYKVILSEESDSKPFSLLRDDKGLDNMYCISPNHGRSFVIGKDNNGRYIISKGNGLSYTNYNFVNTGEFGYDTWGLLLAKDAIRDFKAGNEIRELGIRTNHMEYVIEVLCDLDLKGKIIKPYLLQYSVECPYRINDTPFMDNSVIRDELSKWKNYNTCGYNEFYLIAADVMVKNLYILHLNGVLHNAIHMQNYTWALELLDFELAHTPNYPYDGEDNTRHIKTLFPREIIQTYEIINYIAGITGEKIDYTKVESIFSRYGFDVGERKIELRNFI